MACKMFKIAVTFLVLSLASAASPFHPTVAQTSPSPATYEVLGVLELEATPDKHDQIMVAMLDILPDINRMMQAMTVNSTISANMTEAESMVKVNHIIQTAIAMSRMILEVNAEAQGREVSTEDLQKLKAVETEAYRMVKHYMANYLSTLPNCYCTGTGDDPATATSSTGATAASSGRVSTTSTASAVSGGATPSKSKAIARPVASSPPTARNVEPVRQPIPPQNLQNLPFNSLSNLLKSLPAGTKVL
ncbi:uncharacterized protein [Palaemon carinicauda]|uniref:uncharacterized protein n=1 Tax=Palaemon carinicauda TaxID=392227 RepID=UPI0035B59C27